MRYKTEHPAYDNGTTFERAAKELEQYGFTDQSWHNDACPMLYCPINARDEDYIAVWIDYRDPSKREDEDFSEFSVTTYKRNSYDQHYNFDDLDAALAKAKELAP